MREPFYIKRSMKAFRDAVMEKNHVTIGFVGGSITDPHSRERWSEYVISQFIAEYPFVTVDVENVAIGATGSDYAVFRAQKDLIQRNCDLIFIEFAVNDNPVKTEIRNASREGLIRKLLHGTKADLVITYTYCAEMLKDMLEGRMPASVAEFEQLAEHYSLSSVFMANYALHETLRGTLRWEEWLPDGLHPAGAGSRYYGLPVNKLLKEALEDQRGELSLREIQPLYKDNWERGETFPLHQVKRKGYWRLYRCLDRPLVEQVLSSTCVGSALTWDFVGTGLVVTVSFGWMAADYRWRVDGGTWHEEKPERPAWIDGHNWLRTQPLCQDLAYGIHSAEVEVLPPDHDGLHKGTALEICCIGILKD